MVKILVKSIVILLLLSASMPAEVVTLDKCRELALKNSESIKVAAAELKQAQYRTKEAGTYYLPGLSASGLAFKQKSPDKIALGKDKLDIIPDSAYLASVSVTQPIYTGGKIRAGHKMAEIGELIGESNLKKSREDIVFETEDAYWQYVSVIEKVKIAKRYIELLKELQATVKDSFESGMINRNDLLKVSVRYKRAELNLKTAENARELARLNLCRITGLSDRDSIEVEALSGSPELPSQLLGKVPSPVLRSDYKMLKNSVSLKDREISYKISEYLPQAGFTASLSASGLRMGGDWNHNTTAYAMVNLNIPLFNWNRKKYVRIRAEKDKLAQQENLKRASKLMTLEIRRAQLNLETAFKNLDLSHNYLTQATENMDLSQDNYRAGMEPLADLLEAQAEWQRAKGSVIDSEIECRIMITTCRKSMGILLK